MGPEEFPGVDFVGKFGELLVLRRGVGRILPDFWLGDLGFELFDFGNFGVDAKFLPRGGEILIRVVQNNTRSEESPDNGKNEKLSLL